MEVLEAGTPHPRLYQSSAAEQDHKDDETLEPAVFHNAVAGFAQLPACGPRKLTAVHLAAGTAASAACVDR